VVRRPRGCCVSGKQYVYRLTDQISDEFRVVAGAVSESKFDDDVRTFDMAKLFESLPEGHQAISLSIRIGHVAKHRGSRNAAS
jgi:hypothetical protein